MFITGVFRPGALILQALKENAGSVALRAETIRARVLGSR
jgi:hypothetical protein